MRATQVTALSAFANLCFVHWGAIVVRMQLLLHSACVVQRRLRFVVTARDRVSRTKSVPDSAIVGIT